MKALGALPDGGTFFDSVLSHISEPAFDRLVKQAMEGLETRGPCEACESVITYASLQLPEALRPFLPRLFDLQPNQGAYYENWPWRCASVSDIEFLSRQMDELHSFDRRFKAWECLLETRHPQAFALAEDAAPHMQLEYPWAVYLQEVGYKAADIPLYSDPPFHLIFPHDYLPSDRPAWSPRALHPTWSLPTAGEALRFGGAGSGTCGVCGGILHHLLTLPERHVFPAGAKAGSDISFEVCLSCLGLEQPMLFYHHGDDGRPTPLDRGSAVPRFVAEPLQETQVHLAPTPPRWKWQDWALSNGRENLNRVGGYPPWIQSAEFPTCPGCGEVMHFIMQLDSDLPMADGGGWLWGSGGIGYAFRCAPCRNTAFLWQCT